MTDDDLEQLLRRAYREVAARTNTTTSATPEQVDRKGARSRWQPVLAAAAAVVVVVAGLVVLTGRGGEAPAAMGEPRHIVPGWIPRADPDESERLFALTEIESTTDVDRLVWSADAGAVTLEYDRLATGLPPGTETRVRGADAAETDNSVAWFGPAGGVATVTIDGGVDPGVLDRMTGSLVYLDDATWTALTQFNGFTGGERSLVHTWRIEADEPFELHLEGDLHHGMSIGDGRSGWSVDLDRCLTTISWDLSDLPDDPDRADGRVGYLVVAPRSPAEVIVGEPGEPERAVAMTTLGPMLDMSVGATILDDRSPSEPLPTCRTSEP